jgi:hypothetical protein
MIKIENLIERLSLLLPETGTRCYAWALLPNHAHFLFQSGSAGISTLMRRLLTGYAVSYNRRHKRHVFNDNYIFGKGRQRDRVRARDLVCYWSVVELGISMADLAKKLEVTLSAVSYAVRRGEKAAKQAHFNLED